MRVKKGKSANQRTSELEKTKVLSIQSFNKSLISYYGPDTVPGPGDTAGDEYPCSWLAYILAGKLRSSEITTS